MVIERDIYLKKLISKKQNGLIKVVTGIRRCGKSYLLFHLFKEHLLADGIDEQHIIEIAFDSFENKRFRDPDVLYPYLKEQMKDNDLYYILLDEVQLLDEFESVLNGLIRMKNVDVYVTGSNARFLSKDVITEFRGRGDEALPAFLRRGARCELMAPQFASDEIGEHIVAPNADEQKQREDGAPEIVKRSADDHDARDHPHFA